MQISSDIKRAHGELSNCSAQFLDFVKNEPGALIRSNFRMLFSRNDYRSFLQPWPTFINQETRERFKEAAVKVFALFKSIPKRFFDNDPYKISQYYNISLDMAKFLLRGVTEEYIDNLVGRGDFIVYPSGLKCLEYNIFSNLGGLSRSSLKYVYPKIPIISGFFKKYPGKIQFEILNNILYENLINSVLRAFSPDQREINILTIFPGSGGKDQASAAEIYMNELFAGILREKFNNRSGSITFCDYHHIRIKDDHVFYKDKKIDCIYEWYSGFVPVDILKAFARGNILIFNGPFSALISSKLNMVLLSENEDSEMFNPEERETIKKYIPWTRKITDSESTYGNQKIQLLDFILSNREKLVLKPLTGYGGENIFIGRCTPPHQWQDLVEKALENENFQGLQIDEYIDAKKWSELIEKSMNVRNWLVQEYVDSYSYLYQVGENGCAECSAVWGFFVFGSQYAGEYIRVLPRDNSTGVINVKQGATEGIVFKINE